MTLNGHFALKSGSSSASNGLAFWLSEKIVRKFAKLRIILSAFSNKNVAQRLYWLYISVMGLFISLALTEEEVSNH